MAYERELLAIFPYSVDCDQYVINTNRTKDLIIRYWSLIFYAFTDMLRRYSLARVWATTNIINLSSLRTSRCFSISSLGDKPSVYYEADWSNGQFYIIWNNFYVYDGAYTQTENYLRWVVLVQNKMHIIKNSQ